jgi:hypothetical protein
MLACPRPTGIGVGGIKVFQDDGAPVPVGTTRKDAGGTDDMETLTLQPLDWIVILAGVAAVAWVNWYFFIAPGRSR